MRLFNPPLSSASVIAELGYTPVNKAGDTMTGVLVVQSSLSSSPAAGDARFIGNAATNADRVRYEAHIPAVVAWYWGADSTGNWKLAPNDTTFANPAIDVDETTRAINFGGVAAINGGTVTASTPILNLTQTWNNVAVTFTGIFANVTDTTSASASLLMDLQVGGSSRLSVRKDGLLTSANAIIAAAASSIGWTGRSVIRSPANSQLTLFNAALSDFSLLQWGGATASFPALKRSAAAFQARLADDSAFTFMQAQLQTSVNATTGLTAGVLAATTNASIVVYDAAGQAYRIPCII